jgi:hypothetical protein
LIEAVSRADNTGKPSGSAMNSTTATLSPTQRAWITTLATTITLLIVILLGAAG